MMNRNKLYDYLKSIGLYPVIHRMRKGVYTMEFRSNQDKDIKIDAVLCDWGYVTGCDSIYLCANQVVLVGDYGMTKIYMDYHRVKKFEVRTIESDES